MSNTKTKGLAYSEASPELIALAKGVIKEAAGHRYSVSRIYSVYNAISGKTEDPQTCSSCLRARAREIGKWLEDGAKASKGSEQVEAPQTENEGTTGTAEGVADKVPTPENTEADKVPTPENTEAENVADQQGAEPVADQQGAEPEPAFEVLAMADGSEIVFTPNDGAVLEDGTKGVVKTAEGGSIKAGTYKTLDGGEIRVQVGGKATYLENFDDLAT
jgi:hypothetical protein